MKKISNKQKIILISGVILIFVSYLVLSVNFVKAAIIFNPKEQNEIQLMISLFIHREAQKEIKTQEEFRREDTKLLERLSLDIFVRDTFKECSEEGNCGPGIVDVNSEITFEKIEQLKTSKLNIKVREHRTWHYDDQEKSIGEKICPHRFALSKKKNKWKIEKFENGCEIQSQPHTKENGSSGPSPEQTMRNQTIQLWRMEEVSFDELQTVDNMKKQFPEMKIEYKNPTVINSQNNHSNLIISSYTYNRNNAAWYGLYYALNPNTSFRDFTYSGGDCTNFISQAVWYGNWSMVGWWPDKYSRHSWWYAFIWPNTQSHTWTSANMWRYFTSSRPRGYTTSNRCDLQLGDIVQQDTDRNGTMDHSMLVTYRNGCDIKISYHTPNTRNKSLNEIIRQNPNSYFYAWRLYSSGR